MSACGKTGKFLHGVNGILGFGFFPPNVSNPKLTLNKFGGICASPSWPIENCSVTKELKWGAKSNSALPWSNEKSPSNSAPAAGAWTSSAYYVTLGKAEPLLVHQLFYLQALHGISKTFWDQELRKLPLAVWNCWKPWPGYGRLWFLNQAPTEFLFLHLLVPVLSHPKLALLATWLSDGIRVLIDSQTLSGFCYLVKILPISHLSPDVSGIITGRQMLAFPMTNHHAGD